MFQSQKDVFTMLRFRVTQLENLIHAEVEIVTFCHDVVDEVFAETSIIGC